jgi:hypothetical protein
VSVVIQFVERRVRPFELRQPEPCRLSMSKNLALQERRRGHTSARSWEFRMRRLQKGKGSLVFLRQSFPASRVSPLLCFICVTSVAAQRHACARRIHGPSDLTREDALSARTILVTNLQGIFFSKTLKSLNSRLGHSIMTISLYPTRHRILFSTLIFGSTSSALPKLPEISNCS